MKFICSEKTDHLDGSNVKFILDPTTRGNNLIPEIKVCNLSGDAQSFEIGTTYLLGEILEGINAPPIEINTYDGQPNVTTNLWKLPVLIDD